MKKRIGSKTYLYPMPTTVIGSNVGGKANFCTIAFIGIVNYQPPMMAIGMSRNHHTFKGIGE